MQFKVGITKNDRLFYSILPFFLAFFLLYADHDWFFNQRCGVFLFLGLCFSCCIARAYGKMVGIVAAYCLSSAIWAALWRANQFSSINPLRPAIDRSVLMGTLSWVLAWVSVRAEIIPRAVMERLFLAFGFAVCIHHFILAKFFMPDGPLMSPTLAAIYLVFLIPLAIEKHRKSLLWILPSILLMSGISGYLALFGYVLGYILIACGFRFIALISALPVVCVIAYIKHAHIINSVLHSGRDKHRFVIWAHIWKWFWDGGLTQKLIGYGAGTAYQLVPFLQVDWGLGSLGNYVYLHNSALQALFELGIVGFSLILMLYLRCLYRTYKNEDYSGFGFLLAFAGAGVGMFPERHDAIGFLVIFLLHGVFLSRPKEELNIV